LGGRLAALKEDVEINLAGPSPTSAVPQGIQRAVVIINRGSKRLQACI